MATKSVNKWQYGDFQTPIALAQKAVDILKNNHNIDPDIVIEPTCGKGAFVKAAYEGFEHANILGFEINKEYVDEANLFTSTLSDSERISVKEADFFNTDWDKVLSNLTGYILIIGNPPWVTNSELSILDSKNIPEKSNFQNRKGIDAITGSGNFDISEWMLLQHVNWLSKRNGAVAFLCKYAVARKVMKQITKNADYHFTGHIYPIDAKANFNASVEACFFILTTDNGSANCKIYKNIDASLPSHIIGERDGFIVNDIKHYEKWRHLRGQDARYIWRSGIKHDCSKVMELLPDNEGYKNGLGKIINLESEYIYPLLKSADVGNCRVNAYRKVVLISQKFVGEETSSIKDRAPRTWKYLHDHKDYLSRRKSSIYKNKPPFSVFGIGPYTFKEWKIAISGFYKNLNFNLVGPLDGKTVAFDDTVNFLSFDSEDEARFVHSLIVSKPALEFLESMIFWGEKRPITVDILRRLSLKEIAKELGVLVQYKQWSKIQPATSIGQLELEIAESRAIYKTSKSPKKSFHLTTNASD